MTALRSALSMLRRRSSGSSAAAYMSGRRQETINNEAFAASSLAPPLQPSAIRNNPKEGCGHFSTDVREPITGQAVTGMRMWWHRATYPIHRIKHRMETADMEERTMALYVYTVFVLGTPTVFCLKTARDIYYRV